MAIEIQPLLGKAVPGAKPLAAWLPALIAIGVGLVAFAAAFSNEITRAVDVWVSSTAYNHCFLVLPLFGFLLWDRRSTIALLQPRPALWAVLAMLPLLVLWAGAALMDVLEAQQLLAVALFEVFVFAIIGWRTFKALLAPFLFLFFLVPFGAFLVPALQVFTTSFTVHGLELLGIPVYADRFFIQIPAGSFEVAEACAGLRFLIASIVFGCFFATIMYQSRLRRLIFIVLSLVVPIIANGCSALGLLLLAELEGSGSAVAADHVLYGWLFFSLITLLLIVIGLSFSQHRADAAPADQPAKSAIPRRATAAAATLGVLLMLLGPSYLSMIDRAAAAPGASALAAPTKPWVADATTKGDWHPHVAGAGRESLAAYRSDDATVNTFIALFSLPSRGSPFTKAINALAEPQPWRLTHRSQIAVPVDGKPVIVNADVMTLGSHRRVIWWFYIVDDQMTPSTLVAKLLQARSAFIGGSHVGAFVAISTEGDDLSHAGATLTRFLKDVGVGREVHQARMP